jgi:hypothetical protein
MSAPLISDLRYQRAGDEDRRSGLLGYARFVIGGTLRVDGVAIRRDREGHLHVAFPRGPKPEHPLLRPVDAAARRVLEQAIFEALGREPEDAR